jgi:hypothetical protein
MTENLPIVSNPAGRPKGSKNEITILKMAMESTVRAGNIDQIGRILKGILDDAEAGDKDCRKLVWASVMSKAGYEQQQNSGERPSITLRVEGAPVKQVEYIDVTPTAVSIEENGKAD